MIITNFCALYLEISYHKSARNIMLYNQTLSIVLTVGLLYLSGEAAGVWRQRCGKSQTGTRIVGGEEAVNGKWPWMVRLRLCTSESSCSRCGGSLISDQWILTAAHCFTGDKITQISARLGDYDFDDEQWKELIVPAMQPRIHEGYSTKTHLNDIALLKLYKPLDLTGLGIEPICLPPAKLKIPLGFECYATGWGYTIGDRASLSDKLQQVKLPIDNTDFCHKQFRDFDNDTQLCVGTKTEGKDTCKGDSGGPLNCQLNNGAWVAEGIVSFGNDTCGNEPSVFTRVSSYIPWIEYNTGLKF
ncbi:unnamed protein product [Medioppia subpectinata]|uniref:limulus clotting factor C n=1 Tax=Medioppia subpectinata TaxID=1979941 RepID=A0A7R9KRK1_9ACAR|nr:unnamed protein product [Medioppia subpectinata]CAG2108062.1 unnamed protein product [Medioppia subpectinata]